MKQLSLLIIMETDKLTKHIASVLGDNFNLTFEDIEKEDSEENKEIIYGLICLHEDLHFYKKKSDHLLDNFKTTLFNSAAISITNSLGLIKDVNTLFLNLSGYEESELIGKKLKIIDAPNDQPDNYQHLKAFITSGNTWRGEVASLNKNGEIFWLDTHVFPIKNTEGKIYEYWSVSTEITQRKQIELELVKKNLEMQQFSYIISHDLKAPVRQINQLTELIKEEYSKEFSDGCSAMFDRLMSRATRLDLLIKGILEYSQADYKTSDDTIIDLSELVEDLIILSGVPEHIQVKVTDTLPSVMGNEVKMEQIFENLISNSIKYMNKPNGEITINVDKTLNDFYRFEIIDNGAGIKEKYINSIFDVFVTAHEEKRDDSTGIGLAIIKKIVNSYNGEIGCTSVVNEGSTFWFTWPKIK